MLCITLRMLYHGFPIITALSETVLEKPHKEAFGIAFLSRTEEHTSRNTLTIWRCIKIYFFNICKNCFNQLPLVNFGPKFIYDGETHYAGEDIKLNDFFYIFTRKWDWLLFCYLQYPKLLYAGFRKRKSKVNLRATTMYEDEKSNWWLSKEFHWLTGKDCSPSENAVEFDSSSLTSIYMCWHLEAISFLGVWIFCFTANKKIWSVTKFVEKEKKSYKCVCECVSFPFSIQRAKFGKMFD